ncbi:hypothetical protein WJX73_009746 [Symbiochloris irregularis]|uniref:BZIP domain-containing protein n=1 Tax=Symbiochloris irregularis TaxID=706552 RepID=A0AAW1PBE3_9CHLO
MAAQQGQLDPLMFLDVEPDPLGFLNDPLNARDWSHSGVGAPGMPALPYNTREQQSVMTSLLSTAVDEQRQPTTTFTAQDFPDSYSSYLAGGPHPKTEPLVDGNVDADSSTAALEAKQARVREKNRRAMKKFREKQKEKSKESESRLQELEGQVQALQLRNDKLQSEVHTLKLANFAATRSSSGDEATQARQSTSSGLADNESSDAPEEWEPRYGWTDFDPQATMVMHLGLEDNPHPWRLTQHQLRTMTHPQFLQLFRAFNERILHWMQHANDDLSSPAAQQLYALKYEISAMAANMSMNNPELYHKKWGPVDPALGKDAGNWTPAEPQTPVSAPIPEDVKRACVQLLTVLKISTEQRATMVKVLEMVKADIQRLKAERSSILLSLVEKHNVEEPTLEPRQFSGILSDLRRLTHNAEDIHRAHCIYASTMWSGVLNPIQVGKLCLCCQPNTPNIYMLGAAAAESAADSGDLQAEEAQGIAAQVESRYRQVWAQHSSITQAGQMGGMPIILANEYPNLGDSGVVSSKNLVSSASQRVPGFML